MIIGLTSSSFAQLTGPKSIPGAYASLAAAITDLNTLGVGTGGVTFNIAAGYTETFASPTAGLISASGTSANPIIFQKSGTGSNPVISAGVGTGALDGIIVITGGDYITFDGINLLDPNTISATTEMEWGYALLKRSATAPFDGCQNVTIKNCTITMNKANTGSFGIFCNNQIATSATALVITATTDAMNNCKFFNNTITNSYYGIYLLGVAATTPFTLYDQNNEIGKDGANTITNWGGGSVAAYGIYAAYQNNIKVDNNSVSGNTGNTNTVYGICLGTATSSSAEIIGNTVTVTSSGTTASLAAIFNSAGGTTLVTSNVVTIANNTIQNCTYTTATTGSFYGIVSTTSPYTVNIYGNSIINNSKAGTSGTFYCVQVAGSGIVNCYSNIIHDNSITGASATGSIYGLYFSGTEVSESYHDNTIYNLSDLNTGSVYGIYLSSTSGAKTLYNNVIQTLSSAGGAIYGVNAVGYSLAFYKNQINSFTATAAAGTVYGVYSGATLLNMYNNYVYDLKATASTVANAINGIYLNAGSYANVYYNTVYLNGTSSSATTFGSSGLYAVATPVLDLKNNIIVNTSTPVGTSFTTAFRRSATNLTLYAPTSNNNDFYAGTPGANNLIYYDGTNSDQTITPYISRVSPRDIYSFTEMPQFTTVSGNACRINTSVATQLNNSGLAVTSPVNVTDDFFGNSRNASTPDVGAEEFAGTSLDLSSPAIVFTPFTNSNYTTALTLTATITDPGSGVPVSGSGLPVLYWNINSGINNSTTGVSIGSNKYTFTFGTGGVESDVVSYYVVAQDKAGTPNIISNPSTGAGSFTANPPAAGIPPTTPYTYTITSVALSGDITVGLTAFNKISGRNIYFEKSVKKVLVTVPSKEDNNETIVNTGRDKGILTPVLKGISTDQSLSQFQSVEVEETTWIPMENGKQYDGPLYVKKAENPKLNFPDAITATYATITAAVADLNLRGVKTPTRFLLDDASYASETYPIVINVTNSNAPTATNTVTIKPNTGVTTALSGALASGALVKILNTNFVIIDGSNSVGGTTRDLTITNTSATAPSVLLIGSIGSTPVTNITVKNCIVINGSNGSTAFYVSDGTTAGSGGYFNNITLSNNSIQKAYNAYYIVGIPALGNGSGLTVSGNNINSTGTNAIQQVGIYVQGVDGFTVSNNNVGGFLLTASNAFGIYCATGSKNGTVSGNNVTGFADTLSATNTYVIYGIYVVSTIANANINITNNTVSNFSVTSTNSSGNVWGIITANTSNVNIIGNTISGITSAGTGIPMGVYEGSLSTNVNIQKNKISNIKNTNIGGYGCTAIYLASSSLSANTNVSNNFVSDIAGYGYANITIGDNGYGIFVASGAGYGLYYNSVSMATEQTVATGFPAALNIASTVLLAGALDIRDNIFANSQTIGTNLYSVYCGAPKTVLSNINYNDYYSVTGPSLAYLGVGLANLAALQTATGQDVKSVSQNPVFNSLTDLHLNTSTVPYFLIGTPIAGITTDIDGDTRNATVPYMGADEVMASPLPVELTAFTVSAKNGNLTLNWETKTEHNSAKFIVERSVFEKNNWTAVGEVIARGNSNVSSKYSFTDSKLNAGKFTYRLKMVDVDGRFTYSSIVNSTVELPKTFVLSQNYPNPFNPSTRIDYQLPADAKVTIELFSITGQKIAELVNQEQAAGYYSIEVGSSSIHKGLATGVYVYRMTASDNAKGINFVSIKKMVMLK
jgi:hypothetical protein